MSKTEFNKPHSKNDFVRIVIKKHGYFYNYSKVVYTNNTTKVIIGCPIHGEFLQSPKSHKKYGCMKCGIDKNSEKRKKTIYEFKIESSLVHNNFYDYSLVKYVNSKVKVKIICPIHGIFNQIPNSHVRGNGCKKCACEKTKEAVKNKNGFYSSLRAQRHESEWKDIKANIYFIKASLNNEEFYKIGITTRDVNYRFKSEKHKIEVLYSYDTNLYNASILENIILEENEKYKYIPKNKLKAGNTECFIKDVLKII